MRACISIAAVAALLPAPGLLLSQAGNQTEKKLSAREIFYSAPKAAAVAKKPSPRRKAPAKPAEPAVPSPAPVSPETSPGPVASTAVPEPAPAPAKQVSPPLPPAPGEGQVQFVTAAEETKELVPLGLRYSILKRVGPGDLVEVDPDITFRAGDRIRLRVQVNDDAYLYIIHRGSSGIWKPLFPSPEIAGGDNRVSPGRAYDIPAGYVFTFDEQPGEEKLFLVASRQPETDLENLVYRLSRGEGGAKPAQPAAPAEPVTPAPKTKLLLAHNLVNIDDSLLIIEKVDEHTPGAKKETAVYAVAPSAAPDSRVVVDVTLHHR